MAVAHFRHGDMRHSCTQSDIFWFAVAEARGQPGGGIPMALIDTETSLSEKILKEEHRIYSEAVKIVLEGKYKIVGRRVLRSS